MKTFDVVALGELLIDFTEMFQNGYAGFVRFRQILEIEPDIKDIPGAVALTDVKGDISFDNELVG